MPDIDKHMLLDPVNLPKIKDKQIKPMQIQAPNVTTKLTFTDYLQGFYLVTHSTIRSRKLQICPVPLGRTQAWRSFRSTRGTRMVLSGPRHQSIIVTMK